MLGMSGPASFASGPTTLTFVVSEGNNNVSVATFSMPAAAQKGDLAILFGRYIDTSSVVPAGWTTIVNLWTPELGPTYVCYRIVQTGDSSFTHTPGHSSYAQMIAVFRPDLPINQLVIPTFQVGGPQSDDPAAIVIPQPGTPAVVIACYQSTAAVNPRSFTPAKDGEQTPGAATNLYLAWKVFNGSPSAVTIDQEDEGTLNTLIGGYVEVR